MLNSLQIYLALAFASVPAFFAIKLAIGLYSYE